MHETTTSRPVAASSFQPMSQKLVCATCLMTGRSPPRSRTNGDCRVRGRVGLGDLRLRRARRHAHVDRLEDAAVERHQVRHERHRDAQLLLDLGGVPMREHAVRRQALVDLAEVRALARRLARARDAGLGVDDDVAGDQARRHQRAPAPAPRPSGSSRRRPPAAPPGSAAPRALGHPVGRARRQRRDRVIPARPVAVAAQTKRARQVEDATAALDQLRRDVGRGVLGQGQKHHVVGRQPLEVVRLDLAVPQPRQARAACGRRWPSGSPSRSAARRAGGGPAGGPVPAPNTPSPPQSRPYAPDLRLLCRQYIQRSG